MDREISSELASAGAVIDARILIYPKARELTWDRTRIVQPLQGSGKLMIVPSSMRFSGIQASPACRNRFIPKLSQSHLAALAPMFVRQL